jgi:hypothetical protein
MDRFLLKAQNTDTDDGVRRLVHDKEFFVCFVPSWPRFFVASRR